MDILKRINAGLKWDVKLISGFLPAPSREPLKIAVITTKPKVNVRFETPFLYSFL